MKMISLVLGIAGVFPIASGAQQQQSSAFSVGSATAQRGTTATGVIAVPAGSDSALDIPVAVIHGARPGPTVAFVAGSHGTEYSSIIAMQRLIPRIDATKLAGTVIVVPIINIASWTQMTPHVNPIDRKGMNGRYPGDSSGTQTDRALALMTSQVVAPADVVVDLHGGDLDENLRPYSYWFRGGKPAQDSAALKLIMAFGLDHVIITDIDPSAPNAGRSLSGQALVRGKTVLVAEAGRSGIVAPGDITALVDGSLNVLGALKMLDRPYTAVRRPMWLDGAGARVAADSAGVFVASVDRDTRVKRGQLLGYTTDFLGRKTGEVRSPIDGLVTFVRGVPSMWPRATLVNVLPVLERPAPWKAPTPR
ncbi:MAG TPA: succinylglutamate desuccinylase/aspartoacylase family protein [Gemmatimonadaceae bacterium]|nr:succinylglutamate desuccinylase/aspartoacylase family protein [Gemmatimonadaceae bacterium]